MFRVVLAHAEHVSTGHGRQNLDVGEVNLACAWLERGRDGVPIADQNLEVGDGSAGGVVERGDASRIRVDEADAASRKLSRLVCESERVMSTGAASQDRSLRDSDRQRTVDESVAHIGRLAEQRVGEQQLGGVMTRAEQSREDPAAGKAWT